MRKFLLRVLAPSIIMLVLVPSLALAAGGQVGTRAPEFTLDAHGGGSQSLSQYLGQVVVLFVMGYG